MVAQVSVGVANGDGERQHGTKLPQLGLWIVGVGGEQGDAYLFVHAKRMLPEVLDRLPHLVWSQRPQAPCRFLRWLVRWQDSDGTRAVPPDGRQQGEAVTAANMEVALKEGSRFPSGSRLSIQ